MPSASGQGKPSSHILVVVALAAFLLPTFLGRTPFSGRISGLGWEAASDSLVMNIERAATGVVLELRVRTRRAVPDTSFLAYLPGTDSVFAAVSGGPGEWLVRFSGSRAAAVPFAWRAGTPLVLKVRGADQITVPAWTFYADDGTDSSRRRVVRGAWNAGLVLLIVGAGLGVILDTRRKTEVANRYDPVEMLKPYGHQIVGAAIARLPAEPPEPKIALEALILQGRSEPEALELAYPDLPEAQRRFKLFGVTKAFRQGMDALVRN